MIRLLLFLFITFFSTLNAQSEKSSKLPYTQNTSGSTAYFTPGKPVYGDMITVNFYPGEKSEVVDVDSLYMDVLFLFKDGKYISEEYLMKKNDSGWTTDFELSDDRVGCMAIQFATPDFRKIDCNDKQGWDLMVYAKNGAPIKGANFAYANGYLTHALIRRVQDMDKYRAGMLNELNLFPDDPLNVANTWYFRKTKNNSQLINREVDSLVQKYPDNIKLLEFAYYEYAELKDSLKQKDIFRRILELDPANTIALSKERGNLFFKPAGKDKLKALYNLMHKTEGTSLYKTVQRDYFQNLIRSKNYERVTEFLKEWNNPDWVEIILSARIILTDCYKVNLSPDKLDLSSKLLITDDDKSRVNIMRIAIGMTNYAITGYQNASATERDPTTVPSVWYSNRKRHIGIAYGNFGYAKFMINQFDSALYYYNISKTILGNDFYNLGDDSYYTLLIKMGNTAKAFDEAKKALELGAYNTGLLHQVLRISADNSSREKEAAELIEKDKSSSSKERENEINANFFKEPKDAIDFSLPDLKGNQISLSSLRGKIVVLEFWDTYCGWCLKSFEKLQSFVNKHKNDKDVVFLTINSNPGSEEKRNSIARYLKENKFDFPVLFDENNSVVTSYKFGGVPQTIVIGRDGKVYYRESGYGGPTIARDLEKVVERINGIK